MRLINTSTFELCEGELGSFIHEGYAVLSYRWMGNEVNYQEFPHHIVELQSKKDEERPLRRIELSKIRGACRIARLEKIKWMCFDTCCIDKTNNAELVESINSMFRWYQHAKICITYLSDVRLHPGILHKTTCRGCESLIQGVRHKCLVCHDWDYCSKCLQSASSTHPDHHFTHISHNREADVFHATENADGPSQPSVWFRRGWTLQELLAPKVMKFYDTDWKLLGTKGSLTPALERITGIKAAYLTGSDDFKDASVAAKMSWMAKRETSKREDIAYSMLGLLGINLTPIYGEGAEEAFMRLQYELLSKSSDESLFAWKMPANGPTSPSQGRKVYGGLALADDEWGLLAPSPKWFQDCGGIITESEHFVPRAHGGFVKNQQGILGPYSLNFLAEEHETKVQRRMTYMGLIAVFTIIVWIPYLIYSHRRQKRAPTYAKFALNAWAFDKHGGLSVVEIYIGSGSHKVGRVRMRSQEYCLTYGVGPGHNQLQVQFLQPQVK